MKNKFGITAAAVLVALSLSACSNSNNQSSSSSSNKASSSQVQKKQSNSSSNKQSSSSKPSSQAPEQNRMDKLTDQLRKNLSGMLLPSKDGLGQGSDKLNIRYTQDGSTNTVYYSVGATAKSLNDASIKNEKPYAVLKEVKNASSDTATDLINYQPEQTGLKTKSLDADTKATTQGAAGSTYLQWNKNNYSFVIQANNQLKQDPVSRGKSVLALFNQYGLPATSDKGSLSVKMGDSEGSLNTVIAWKHGNDVYQIKAHDTETAFKMLASLK